MRLVIDLDLDRLPKDQSKEASRILRFWAGALSQIELTQSVEHALMDSDYQPVGSLRLLDPDAEGATPQGYHTLTPRMVVADVAGAVQFLRATFDATGELRDGRPAEVRVGDSLVIVTEAGERDLFPVLLYVYVADVDESYRRAIAAGAMTIEAPLDTPYGDRRAMVRDPYGNVFQIAHRACSHE